MFIQKYQHGKISKYGAVYELYIDEMYFEGDTIKKVLELYSNFKHENAVKSKKGKK